MSVQTRSVAAFCVLAFAAGFSACQTSPREKEAKFLKRGHSLLEQKDYARALLEFRNAATAVPNDAEPHYQMGLAYLASGDGVSAYRAFQKATTLNPKHFGAQVKLAEFMTASQDEKTIQEAVTRLEGTLGDSPDNQEAITALAVAEWRLGKPEDATQRLEQALRKFPTSLQSSVTLARMRVAAKDWAGAEEVLKKAVAGAPKSSAAELALAELYVSMRLPARAESELKRAVELDPKNGAHLQDLGALQVAAKRMDEAERTFKQLSALPEKAYKPVHALFLFNFGKREAALPEFEALAKADPADRDARSRLVAAYSRDRK